MQQINIRSIDDLDAFNRFITESTIDDLKRINESCPYLQYNGIDNYCECSADKRSIDSIEMNVFCFDRYEKCGYFKEK